MVHSTLDKSNDTIKSSEVVNKKVTEGGSKVSHLVNAISGIKKSNDRLREVNAVIKAIAKKTGLIDDIFFKTQLLALNDSIEAAKAGEHVRSFSLVSEEVSKLALSSGEAAEKISDLIEQSDIKVT